MMAPQGYLVVLRQRDDADTSPLHAAYRGIDRIPVYHDPMDIPEEQEAMDAYMFGDYEDDHGFIPILPKAQELLDRFRHSPRHFEIIHCRLMDHMSLPGPQSPELELLGYDVGAADSPFYSVLTDLEKTGAQPFRQRVNRFGLLSSSDEARMCMDACRPKKGEEGETPVIWEVCGMAPYAL